MLWTVKIRGQGRQALFWQGGDPGRVRHVGEHDEGFVIGGAIGRCLQIVGFGAGRACGASQHLLARRQLRPGGRRMLDPAIKIPEQAYRDAELMQVPQRPGCQLQRPLEPVGADQAPIHTKRMKQHQAAPRMKPRRIGFPHHQARTPCP